MAVMSGNLLRLMVLDFRERKRYAHRAGIGWRLGVVVVLTFVVSVAVCVAFFLYVASGQAHGLGHPHSLLPLPPLAWARLLRTACSPAAEAV